MKQNKVWGCTELVWEGANVEVHRIFAKSSGYCSEHYHEHKYNLFFVESGLLEITIFRDNVNDVTLLGPSERSVVAPKEMHMFRALEDTVAYEIYWVNIEKEDIIRRTTGGIDKNTNDNPELPNKLVRDILNGVKELDAGKKSEYIFD